MSFGTVPGVGGHALFVPLFLLGTAINYLAVAPSAAGRLELSVMAVPHLAFIAWLRPRLDARPRAADARASQQPDDCPSIDIR